MTPCAIESCPNEGTVPVLTRQQALDEAKEFVCRPHYGQALAMKRAFTTIR